MSNQLAVITPGLPAVVAKAIRFRMRDVFDADGEYEARVIDRAIVTGDHDEATLRAALAAVDAACQPGGERCATLALTLLRSRTAHRSTSGGEPHVIGKAYAELLAEYPADVIDQACRGWAGISKWWPTWFDLKTVCDRLCARRLAEHKALTEAIANLGKPRPKPLVIEQHRETPEDRLTSLIAISRKHNRMESAAKAEVSLAKLQGRDPEPWAQDENPKPRTPTPAAWAGNASLLEAARKARAKLLEGDQP
jgi:hypothetical protein